MGLHRNRIHRALSRPNLLMGADRKLVLITGLAAVIQPFDKEATIRVKHDFYDAWILQCDTQMISQCVLKLADETGE